MDRGSRRKPFQNNTMQIAVGIALFAVIGLRGTQAALAGDGNTSAQHTTTDTVTEQVGTAPTTILGISSSQEVQGNECKENKDCKENLVCKQGICTCHDATATLTPEKACLPGREGDAAAATPVSKPHIDPNMIIIMVVLGVMFVGMCLALHLFSRSRFRNNRTIFNSPHPRLSHIKLGKKQGGSHRRTSHSSLHVPMSRQPSICSQRSPQGSRRGSPADSQENLKEPPSLNGQLGAPIAKLDETTPSTEDVTKDNWKGPGPDVVKEASVVQNGPNSPTIIVTHTSGSRSPSGAEAPSPIARV